MSVEQEKDAGKRVAAEAAAARIESGMTVGLGTGSTSEKFIDALADRVAQERLQIRGVATSEAIAERAQQRGISVVALGRDTRPDVAVDGADEVDPHLCLIKGGGAALLREKLVASAAREFWVIADGSKSVQTLGAFPLPVVIVPFGWETTRDRLHDLFGVPAMLRQRNHTTVTTDDGLYIVDLHFGAITDPATREREIKTITGVVEVGLFVGIATRVLYGHHNGTVIERAA